MKILVMDDEAKICRMIQDYLSLDGHEVFIATPQDDVAVLVQNAGFDIALLDVLMPNVSGIDLIDKIKTASPTTRVIMMTGKLVDSDLLSHIVEKGASSCMQKPFTMNELVNELQKHQAKFRG